MAVITTNDVYDADGILIYSKRYFDDGSIEVFENGTTTSYAATPETILFAQELIGYQTKESNQNTLRSRADAALNVNNDFLALASPTNAQVLAQVRVLTKENNALIRLILDKVNDISDTE